MGEKQGKKKQYVLRDVWSTIPLPEQKVNKDLGSFSYFKSQKCQVSLSLFNQW